MRNNLMARSQAEREWMENTEVNTLIISNRNVGKQTETVSEVTQHAETVRLVK